MKKALSFVLAFICLISLSVPAFAAEVEDEQGYTEFMEEIENMNDIELTQYLMEIELQYKAEQFDRLNRIRQKASMMSDEEINAAIDQLALQAQTYSNNAERLNVLQEAWILAARLAYNAGYPCAGTLVEYSASGINYYETDGLIASEIETTSAYRRWKSNTGSRSITFEKSDNADLFFGIHHANIGLIGNSSGAQAVVTDRFDFDLEPYIGDLFATIVNNWGWLSQQVNALTPISIRISITQ